MFPDSLGWFDCGGLGYWGRRLKRQTIVPHKCMKLSLNPAKGILMADSRLENLQHSRRVDELLLQLIAALQARITQHDLSKLEEPEKSIFDEYTPKLKDSTYGSEEYWGYLKEMQVALDHHYANNRHHPEHFANGVNGMTLIDVVEMFCDWKAATERHEDGDLERSLEIQRKRFMLSNQFVDVLRNTANEADWL
jgi:hypothetical protein